MVIQLSITFTVAFDPCNTHKNRNNETSSNVSIETFFISLVESALREIKIK